MYRVFQLTIIILVAALQSIVVAQTFQALYQLPAKDIEIGSSNILWSVSQTHRAFRINLTTGIKIDSVNFNIQAGNNGRGVAWDGTNLWYSEWGQNKIYVINPLTGDSVHKYNPPVSLPQGLAYGGGYIWHTNESNYLIYKINPANGLAVSTLPVPENTGRYVGIAYSNGTLWLSNIDTYKIYQINAATGALIYSTTFPYGTTGDITCDNNYLYLVGDPNETLYRYPIGNTLFQALYQLPAKDIEIGSSNILWSVSQTHRAFRINLTTGIKIDSVNFNIQAGNNGRGVAWDGTNLWYSEWGQNKIYVINPLTGDSVHKYNPPVSLPQGLAYGGGYIWHTNESNYLIYKINPANGCYVKTQRRNYFYLKISCVFIFSKHF